MGRDHGHPYILSTTVLSDSMSPQRLSHYYVILSFPTADFTNLPITIEIPAAANDRTQEFVLPTFFQVIDDDIEEYEQSFAIVAELGPDVPDTPFIVLMF